MDFDIKRLGLGERIIGGGAVLLFLVFFFFDWYSVSFGPIDAGISAWDAHTFLRWLILLTIIGALAHTFMQATGRSADLPAHPGQILTGLAGLTTVLLLFRMFINQPGPSNKIIDLSFGAWLGLIALIAIVVGAVLSMQEAGIAITDVGGAAKRDSSPPPAAPAATPAPAAATPAPPAPAAPAPPAAPEASAAPAAPPAPAAPETPAAPPPPPAPPADPTDA